MIAQLTNLPVSVNDLLALKKQLAVAQQEATTGAKANLAQELGSPVSSNYILRSVGEQLEALQGANTNALNRLDQTQTALAQVQSLSQNVISQILSAKSTGNAKTLQSQAAAALKSLTDILNTQVDGAYLFSGVTSQTRPLADYQDGSAAKTAVDAAFQSAFGFPSEDPAVPTIGADALENFLDGAFAGLFGASSWKTLWSKASDQTVSAKIAPSVIVPSTVSANAAPFSDLVQALVMTSQIGNSGLNTNATQAVLSKAAALAQRATNGINDLQTAVGVTQAQTHTAAGLLKTQITLNQQSIDTKEAVDPYEAATRVSALSTQIETAYTLTNRLNKLSLLNYLT
jgi:flagellar hook-associated protein 3 FlgL